MDRSTETIDREYNRLKRIELDNIKFLLYEMLVQKEISKEEYDKMVDDINKSYEAYRSR